MLLRCIVLVEIVVWVQVASLQWPHVVNLFGIDLEPRPKILARESGKRPRLARACSVTTGNWS